MDVCKKEMILNNESEKKIAFNYKSLYFVSIIVGVLLVLRDVQGISISKYILIAIIGLYVFIADLNKVSIFMAFLMPIYVGLPGNYITIIFLCKFVMVYLKNPQIFCFRIVPTISGFFACAFILIQNYWLNYINAYYLICAAEMVLVLFLFSYKGEIDYKQYIYMYTVSVAFLCAVTLINNLKIYDLTELMNASTRLGLFDSTQMILKLDPNYLGYFAIAAISSALGLIFIEKCKAKKVILAICAIVSIFVSFVGLSRTFLLTLLLWIAIICFAQREKGKVFLVLSIGMIILGLIFYLNPMIINSLFERFSENDITTGNGRITLVIDWFDTWKESLITTMFGTGLFRCTVHCMPLQYLFGIGIVGGGLILSFAVSNIRYVRTEYGKVGMNAYIPMFIIFLVASTVPVAQSLTFMFPTVIAVIAARMYGEGRLNEQV